MNAVNTLMFTQMLAGSGLTLVVILAGIIGADFAPKPSWATVPVSLAIVAMALASVPAAMLMRRVGRRVGFICGTIIGAIGALVTALAIGRNSFELLCLGAMLIGAATAFAQQYRFAAAESVPLEQAGRAISRVLIGTLVAASIGPQIALAGRHLTAHEYVGSFLIIAAFYVAGALNLLRLHVPDVAAAAGDALPDASESAAQSSQLRIAIFSSACAYAVMSFVMTAAPISMHTHSHHTLEATTLVIQSHVLAMYLPSLFSGQIIGAFGERRVMIAGASLFAACIVASLIGHEVMHYWIGLMLLGVGWNFLFVAGTTLLTRAARGGNRHRIQALNEFVVFGSQACASLLAGLAVQGIGWRALNLATLPILAALLLVAIRLRPTVRRIGATREAVVGE